MKTYNCVPNPKISRLISRTLFTASILALSAGRLNAQASEPVVGACSGVRLPPSVITGVMAPVVTGIATPLEDSVNQIIDVVAVIPIVGETIPPVDTDVSGLLDDAASGDPITLQVYDTDGNPVDEDDRCNLQADSITLAEPAGIAIGGNSITGLGADGDPASAGEINSIAFGNGASTAAAAPDAVAIGHDAEVTAANSVAVGAGSSATRGPQLSYAALEIAGPSTSAGEFSVGAPGAERQITNLAPGSAPSDAVNVAQLQGVVDDVAANTTSITTLNSNIANQQIQIDNHETRIDTLEVQVTNLENAPGAAPGPVRYADGSGAPNDGTPSGHATLVGTGGPVALHNVAEGALAAGSTDAVNGAQLHATNQQVAANTIAITNLTNSIGGSTVGPVQYSNADTPTVANGGTVSNDVTLVGAGGGAVRVHNVADGNVAAGSTDAVNGGQLNAVGEVADAALALAENSVQYDSDGSVTLGDGAAPVVLHNVGDGVEAGDAVNLGQLDTGLQSTLAAANQYTDLRLGELDTGLESALLQANQYTDIRIDRLSADMTMLKRDLEGGIAGALAAAGMPQASDPGRGMIAAGFGVYQGEVAFAFGASARLRDARTVFRVGATFDSRGRSGGNAGVGIQF